MRALIYIDKGTPLVSVYAERLTDGSEGWNIDLNGRTIHFRDEKSADEAFRVIEVVLRNSNEEILVL